MQPANWRTGTFTPRGLFGRGPQGIQAALVHETVAYREFLGSSPSNVGARAWLLTYLKGQWPNVPPPKSVFARHIRQQIDRGVVPQLVIDNQRMRGVILPSTLESRERALMRYFDVLNLLKNSREGPFQHDPRGFFNRVWSWLFQSTAGIPNYGPTRPPR